MKEEVQKNIHNEKIKLGESKDTTLGVGRSMTRMADQKHLTASLHLRSETIRKQFLGEVSDT